MTQDSANSESSAYADALSELGQALTELRRQRGTPSFERIRARGLRSLENTSHASASSKATMSGVFAGKQYISLDKLLWLVRAVMSWDEDGAECDPPGRRDLVLEPWRNRWLAIDTLRTVRRRARSEAESTTQPQTSAPRTPPERPTAAPLPPHRGTPQLDALQDVLAQEIGDPTLRLLLPGRGGMLTDLTGRPVKAGLTRTRALTPINRSDRLLCVIEHDAALTETNQTARIAFAFTGLVMESVWLSTQVIESRRRLLEAELAERRRIERDIHDGAQQGFYEAITLLDTARSRAVAEGSIALADQLATTKDRLTDALKVLRKISQRVHPHTLVHHGLRESVAGLARDHSGVLTYEIPDQRWPSRVESTAYFVIAEGVSNVIEHAALGASIHVMVTTDGDDLVVTFIYKGQGGADVSSDGLGSLEDRVAAAGGHLVVDSARRGDTRLVARLPNEVSIESPSLEGDDS